MEPENNRRLYAILLDVAKKVSMGDYDNVDSLMELTNPEKYPAPVSELAEAFGMMIVRVESREYNLEQLLEELREKNVRLEASLKRVRLLEGVQSHLSKFVPPVCAGYHKGQSGESGSEQTGTGFERAVP